MNSQQSVKRMIVRYLKGASEQKGMRPYHRTKDVECFVEDAISFAGGWLTRVHTQYPPPGAVFFCLRTGMHDFLHGLAFDVRIKDAN